MLSLILTMSWALWFGGMVGLILFVTQLFGASRDLGIHAAPVLFRVFAVYQIFVGMIACGAATMLSLVTRQKRHAMVSLVLLAALVIALVIRGWTGEMLSILQADQSSGPHFQAMHHKSSTGYAAASVLLFVAGIGLILTLPTKPQKAVGTVPA